MQSAPSCWIFCADIRARCLEPYLHIDLGKQENTLDAFRFVPHRPSLAWRYLVSHKYPPLVPEKASSPILDRFLIELGRTSVRH